MYVTLYIIDWLSTACLAGVGPSLLLGLSTSSVRPELVEGPAASCSEMASAPFLLFVQSPRVYQLNAASFKISCVASGHCCSIGARDGCNLAVKLADRPADGAALGGDGCAGFGGGAVVRQATAVKAWADGQAAPDQPGQLALHAHGWRRRGCVALSLPT